MSVYQIQTLDSECAAAFKTIRLAGFIFTILAMLAILTVPFAASMVLWGKVLETTPKPTTAPASKPATAPAVDAAAATMPASAPADESLVHRAAAWRGFLTGLLSAATVVGPLLAVLIVITMFLSSNLALVARCGGIGKFFGAFFWASILLILLLPWQNIMPGTSTAGIWADVKQIAAAMGLLKSEAYGDRMFYYVRFLAYPAVAVVVWVMLLVRFLGGYKAMNATTSVRTAPTDTPAPADTTTPPTEPTSPRPPQFM